MDKTNHNKSGPINHKNNKEYLTYNLLNEYGTNFIDSVQTEKDEINYIEKPQNMVNKAFIQTKR